MNKATANYWVDMLIAVAFVLSAISGLVFLLPGDLETGVLWVSYRTWNTLHTWSSLAMIVGVGLHLVLHWKWLVAMTKRTFARPARVARLEPVVVCVEAKNAGVSRRGFICMGLVGLATFAGAAAAVKALSGEDEVVEAAQVQSSTQDNAMASADSTEPTATATAQAATVVPAAANAAATSTTAVESQPAATSTVTTKKLTVRCPKGLTYDPYPGRCRLYRDTNGDGYCDYSIPS